MKEGTSQDRPVIALAHRGASGHEPENTLRAFARALELGAHWVEFDVRVVADEAVIFHDRSLKRCTGKSGVLAHQSLAQIRSYDVGKGERIPLLSEALALLKGRAGAQIELKGPECAAVVAARVREALEEGWQLHDLLVSSFDYDELLAFARILPQVPRAVLLYGYPWNMGKLLQRVRPATVHLHIDSVTPARIQYAQKQGCKVFVYPVDEPADIAWLKGLGVDGIFSNYPERVLTTPALLR